MRQAYSNARLNMPQIFNFQRAENAPSLVRHKSPIRDSLRFRNCDRTCEYRSCLHMHAYIHTCGAWPVDSAAAQRRNMMHCSAHGIGFAGHAGRRRGGINEMKNMQLICPLFALYAKSRSGQTTVDTTGQTTAIANIYLPHFKGFKIF